MEDCIRIVQEHYDSDVQKEWDRLERHPFEFAITTRMMNRYIKPGDRILDIGGGPGRYSIYYAKKGCNVTLVDLSTENIKFALEKSKEANIHLRIERNKTENRLLNKPTKRNLEKSETIFKNLESKYRLNSYKGEITKENYIKINNTNLSPEEAALIIKSKFSLY